MTKLQRFGVLIVFHLQTKREIGYKTYMFELAPYLDLGSTDMFVLSFGFIY